MILWARDVLKSHPGATIIADVKASQVLFDEIAARRRHAADVEDRPFADQDEDGRAQGAARRRDERPYLLRRHLLRLRRRALCGLRLLDIVAAGNESLAEMRDELPAARQHAGAALRLRRGAQVRDRRRGQGAAAAGRRQGQRHRRRARQHARRLVAAARLQHPGRAGGALRERQRGGSRAPQGATSRPPWRRAASACRTRPAGHH